MRMVEFFLSSNRHPPPEGGSQYHSQVKLDTQSRTRIAKELLRLPRPDQRQQRNCATSACARAAQCRPTACTPSRTAQGSHAV